MKRLDGNDELISKIAAVDPAAHLAPMTEGALERVSRHAMNPMPKTWTWRRFQVASLGALVGSGGLALAGILGIQAAGTSLPILALGQSSAGLHGSAPKAQGGKSNAMMIRWGTFNFTADPSLSSSAGSGTAYQLSSSIDAAAAASQLAQALNVAGDVTSTGPGSYQVGPRNGPDVSTWTSNGVTSWSYYSASPFTVSSSDGTPPPTDPSLPTNEQASQEALALLGTLGVTNQLGTPSASNYGTEVDVTIPIVLDGLTTDQTFYVTYGANNELTSVSGQFVTAAAQTTYPTISQTDAVNVLVKHGGAPFYGGVMPMGVSSGSPSAGFSTAPSSSSGTSSPSSAPTSGAVGNSSPPFTVPPTTTPTDPTTTIAEPVFDVNVNQATMQLSTYTLTDGTSWLLPTWALAGPETGSGVGADTTYTANILAVDSQYVQLQQGPMVY